MIHVERILLSTSAAVIREICSPLNSLFIVVLNNPEPAQWPRPKRRGLLSGGRVTPQVMIPVDRAVLALPPALDRLAVEPLCRAVQQRLAAGEPLLIDAIRVDRVSTAAIQVLLAAARSAAARGVVFRVSGASAALNGIVAWCGEQRWLSGSIPSTIRGRCAR